MNFPPHSGNLLLKGYNASRLWSCDGLRRCLHASKFSGSQGKKSYGVGRQGRSLRKREDAYKHPSSTKEGIIDDSRSWSRDSQDLFEGVAKNGRKLPSALRNP